MGLIEKFLLMSQNVTDILEQTPLVSTSYDGGPAVIIAGLQQMMGHRQFKPVWMPQEEHYSYLLPL